MRNEHTNIGTKKCNDTKKAERFFKEPASSKFWGLEKKIKNDKRATGVLAEGISRSNMKILMMDLINEGAISQEDFEGFSEDFREQLVFYCERMSNR